MKCWVILILISFISIQVNSQIDNTPEEYLDDGFFFFLAEDYPEALFNFLQLKETDLYNDNIKYKIGICYLNIQGEEPNGIPYFEEASKNTTLRYRKRSQKENQAPWHAHFYLGKAYRINNQLDKALESYNTFADLKNFDDKYNLDMVKNEINSCEIAKIIQDIPIKIEESIVEEPVNNSSPNYNPVISQDENTIIFMTNMKFYNAIFQSKKVDGKWTEPENITPQVGSDGETLPTSISYNGKELYLVKGNNEERDIYISRLEDGGWTKMDKLGENINSKDAESHASVSPDGNVLYFTSNRRGGFGQLDIYRSEKMTNGKWGPAENLGPQINTPYNEETPYISANGNILYFSSEGHYNMGGFDIFFSEMKENGDWNHPTNIGYPLNTTGDNIFYNPIGSGDKGYIAKIDQEEGFGNEDIYRITILSEEEVITEDFSGIIDMGNQVIEANKNFSIKIVDKSTKKVVATLYYDKVTKKFTYVTESGNYEFKFED